MEKVLIVTYFFPPCSQTASQRPESWYKFLPDYGFKPIIITRSWTGREKTLEDLVSGNFPIKSYTETSAERELNVLCYKPNLRDKIYAKYGEEKFRFLRRLLSFLELLLQKYTLTGLSSRSIYDKADCILKSDKSIRKLIITGKPFLFFQIGFLLKKKYPHIEWIADYRDAWNGSEIERPKGILKKLLAWFEIRAEKKWVGSAKLFTTVSDYYVELIKPFAGGTSGKVLLNGYWSLDDFPNQNAVNKFVITYNGSLYSSQNIEVFLSGFIQFVDKYKNVMELKLKFPGILFVPDQAERVLDFVAGYESFIEILDRIEKQEVIQMQRESDLLLMISHDGAKGIPSSKLYEYIGLLKPILLCPSDNDIVHNTLVKCELGIISNTSDEVFTALEDLLMTKLKGQVELVKPNMVAIQEYSRRYQTKLLADYLSELN